MFVVEVGTPKGEQILRLVPHRLAQGDEWSSAECSAADATAQMGRAMDTTNIKELLYRNYDHPRWDDVAGRCLTCANCTMVCPTCFCSTVEEVTDLTADHAEPLAQVGFMLHHGVLVSSRRERALHAQGTLSAMDDAQVGDVD